MDTAEGQEQEHESPIVSTITSTAGKDNNHHRNDMNNNNNNINNNGNGNQLSGDEEDMFDDEFEDADSAEWGDAEIVDVDELRIVERQISLPLPANVSEENPNEEGHGSRTQPKLIDSTIKCWLCRICSAINNLQLTLGKYNNYCAMCGYHYDLEVTYIFSDEWDEPNPGFHHEVESIYEVWSCTACTTFNSLTVHKCIMCKNARSPNAVKAYTSVKPKTTAEPQHFPAPRDHRYDNNNVRNNGNGNKDLYKNKNKNQNQNQNDNGNNNRKAVVAVKRNPRFNNIGVRRVANQYPTQDILDQCEPRLLSAFGYPYRNEYYMFNNTDSGQASDSRLAKLWSVGCSVSCSSAMHCQPKFGSVRFLNRGMALNAYNGWLACVSETRLSVYRPIDGNNFKIVAFCEFPNGERLSGADIGNGRVRFSRDSIFVFSFKRCCVSVFKVTALAFNKYSVAKFDVIKEKYFAQSKMIDFAINNDMLIILFDRWLGVYKLKPQFKWYHAVAYANKSVSCFSVEHIEYDMEYASADSADNRAFYGRSAVAAAEEEKSNSADTDTDTNTNNTNNNNNNNNSDGDQSYHFMEAREITRRSNRNYFYVNCESVLIAIHPANPTFEYVYVGKNCEHGKNSNYCVSKQYGCFWLSDNGCSLNQSPQMQEALSKVIFQCALNKALPEKQRVDFNAKQFISIDTNASQYLLENIERFYNVMYDETFGISGRLLLYSQNRGSTFVLHQMFNYNEVYLLFQELNASGYVIEPGLSSKRPFNVHICVYEMLYGSDLIEQWLASYNASEPQPIPNTFAVGNGISYAVDHQIIQKNNNNNNNRSHHDESDGSDMDLEENENDTGSPVIVDID